LAKIIATRWQNRGNLPFPFIFEPLMQDYFQYLNQYYDKIYVLSVESATERRQQFARRFEGLNYTFFFGADKNKFTVEQIESAGIFSEKLTRHHHRYSKTMRQGEIACSWSHKLIYEDMLAQGFERIMVFEDDAVPDPQALQHIQQVIQEIPATAELVMWGWNKNGDYKLLHRVNQALKHTQHRLGLLKWDHTVIRNLYARKFSGKIKKAGFHDYTYAYGISKAGAQKLVSMQTPIQFIADNLLAHACAREVLNGYITWPAVFQHDNLPDGTHRDSYIR
jgi:glycosyl transferase, family 25